MIIRNIISNLLAHFHPLALTKQVTPHQHKSVLDFTHQAHSAKPWVDAHLVDVTAEDFA